MKQRSDSGFSLIEMLIVLAMLVVFSGAVFRVISLSMERSVTEQIKLDMFQEAREFMDQMTRDLRMAGYPNKRNFVQTLSPPMINPVINDKRAAVGLVKVAAGELWFEGDVDGSGKVSVVRYFYDNSTDNNCPCLKRSQLPKIDADPLTAQTAAEYQVEVQGVKNNPPIFSAYSNAALLGLPLTIGANPTTIASVDTIQATLSLEATAIDPKTKKKPLTTLVTTVKLNNCSQAAQLQQTSCN